MGRALAKREAQLEEERSTGEALRAELAAAQEQLLVAQEAATTSAAERLELQQARLQMKSLREKVGAGEGPGPEGRLLQLRLVLSQMHTWAAWRLRCTASQLASTRVIMPWSIPLWSHCQG